MRLIAGEFKGRRLAPLAPGTDVRPTSDRAREALFSMLGDLTGAKVLDLFSGTGALGIEALSRGAEAVTLVDIDTGPATANVEILDIAERVDVVQADTLAYLDRSADTFGLITCDPPYGSPAGLAVGLARSLPPRLEPGGRLVLESASKTPMGLDLIGFNLERERRYGDSLLRIWRKER